MRVRLDEIVFDCAEPRSLAVFWAGLLGGEPVHRSADWSYLDAPLDSPGTVRFAFQRVPEPKSGKNRLHVDIEVDSIPEASLRAEALGAERSGGIVTDENGSFQVLYDIEGNEFCFVRP
ncbi:VOC family protein [Streptomyces physcomitrii]|uniref:VOC family protein n=1 Tax=Streptomyces physcomitrii TaxID=2724184 RepID=A0ABX1H8W3_9ACTN|nr:VOC family protein [Streptomyces physcomitrii]NKI44528.1 VOC family protein [Streptomyces physcomitrii]